MRATITLLLSTLALIAVVIAMRMTT